MALFDDLIPKAPKAPGVLRSAADTGVALAKGGALGVKMLADAFGAENAVSRVAGDAVDAIGSLESAYSKWEQQQSAQEMQTAQDSGSTWEEVKAAGRAFARRPVDFTAEAIGTSLPTLAAAFLPGGQGAAIVRIGAMLGLGGAQGAGAVKGQIYEAVEQEWTKAGSTPEEAAARAAQAQEYFGSNQGQIALGTALGAAAGTLGAEANILGKRVLSRAAQPVPEGASLVQRAAGSLPGRVGIEGLKEAAPEALQGGQEQYAANMALRGEGFDVDPMQGVAGNATLEALGGFGAGGLAEVATPKADVREIGAASTADEAIDAYQRATTLALPAPALPSDWEIVDGVRALPGPPGAPGQPAPTALLPGPDGQVYIADERGNVIPQPAAQRAEAVTRGATLMDLARERQAAIEALGKQTPRGAEPQPPAPAPIPTGEATELVPAGEATEVEPIPVGEATELIDTGDAAELPKRIPVGKATEIEPEVITPGAPDAGRQDPPDDAGGVGAARVPVRPQPGGPGAVRGPAADTAAAPADRAGGSDRPGEGPAAPSAALSGGTTELTTGDGKPYGTRSAAAVRAKKEGGEVVEVEGGWVVRVSAQADPEWSSFDDDTGTLKVPRADMPQIKAEHRGAMVNFLKARGIAHETEAEVAADSLKPTQAEFSPAKVAKAREFTGGDRSILVSSDGHVLDGHHQWMAKREAGEPVKVIRLDAPIRELLTAVKDFPSAEASEGAHPISTTPAADRPSGSASASGKRHPKTIMGSTLLAAVSRRGGLDPAWLPEFSTRFETARSGKDGRPIVQWRNPLVPGVGRLFRKGGTQDLQLLAELAEEAGYLEPGAVEADTKEAGERAKELIRAALNREDVQTLDELEAERQADEDAEREAYYAEIDAESAAELEAERQALMAEAGLTADEQGALDDIPWDAPGTGDRASAMRALGFSEQEIADETGQEQGPGVGPEEAARTAPQGADEGRAPGEDPADAPRREGEAEGLKRDPGQLPEGVRLRVQAAVDRLAAIREDLQRQLDGRGHGYTFKTALIEKLPAIRAAREPLNEFRKHAERQGFNAEAIITKLGGDLNLEPFVVNDKVPSLTLPNDERLLVMPCCDGKLDRRAPAGDLYQGVMWQTLRAHQPGGGMPNVLILSAKHGLIDQAAPIDPYDQRMTPERLAELQRDMQDNVAELERALKGREINDVLIVGGADYRVVMADAVAELMAKGLVKPGATVNGIEGQIGEQRKALGEYLRALPAPVTGALDLEGGEFTGRQWTRQPGAIVPAHATYTLTHAGKPFLQVVHAGHPTALRPYYLRGPGLDGAPDDPADRKFSQLVDAKAAAERLLDLSLAREGAAPAPTGKIEEDGGKFFVRFGDDRASHGPFKTRAAAEAYAKPAPSREEREQAVDAEPEGLVVMPADADVLAQAMREISSEAGGQARGENERYSATFRPALKPVSLPKVTTAKPTAPSMPFLPKAAADKRLQSWKAEAARQGDELTMENAQRTVISLFDVSGVLAQPWVDAGYNVVSYDLQSGTDINDFSAENLLETHGNDEVWAVLAQPPCTDFASSGAQWWKDKDEDGRTEASNELVRQSLRIVELFRPPVWVMENPVGRIARLNQLPDPLLSFDPWHFGDTYTKRTLLWGNFNNELPTAPTKPVEGSRMHKLSSSAKYERSLTSEGFAYALFMANNADGMPTGLRLSREFAGVDASLFDAALKAGKTEREIRTEIEDSYYDSDLDYVRGALMDMADGTPGRVDQQVQADTAEDAAEAEGQKLLGSLNDDQLKRAADELGIKARTPRDRRSFIGVRLAGGRSVETLPVLKKVAGAAKPARDDAIISLRKQKSALQKLVECLSR